MRLRKRLRMLCKKKKRMPVFKIDGRLHQEFVVCGRHYYTTDVIVNYSEGGSTAIIEMSEIPWWKENEA